MEKAARESKQTISEWIRRIVAMELNGSTNQEYAPAGKNWDEKQSEKQPDTICEVCGAPVTAHSLTAPAHILCGKHKRQQS
jgi:hypothetical protein